MLLTDLVVGKVYLIDLRTNLEASEVVGELVKNLEEEQQTFTGYVRGDAEYDSLEQAIMETEKSLGELPDRYEHIGKERFALTEAIRNAYQVYAKERTAFLGMNSNQMEYLAAQYKIYEMQDYLNTYASELMTMTTEAGNEIYSNTFPRVVILPLVLFGISVLMIVSIARLSQAMNTSLIEPLYHLADASKKISENDFSGADLVAENPDEIGDLIHAFNKMKFATSEYITALEERRETLELLHAEELQKIGIENQLERTKFEALRNQMNPHFLFNTLNVIGGMANLEDAEVTEKMIKALSNLFRYNLRNEELEIPLEQDIKVVEDYLYLQKMRFGERITWKTDYAPEVANYLVPTFMFQPFVENAIVHGIAPKVEGGEICIAIEKREDLLFIEVRDTGVGMTGDELEALKKKLLDADDLHKGIGLGNIYRRISLMYDDGKLEIDSVKDQGTTIRVVIPARE